MRDVKQKLSFGDHDVSRVGWGEPGYDAAKSKMSKGAEDMQDVISKKIRSLDDKDSNRTRGIGRALNKLSSR